MDWRGLGCETWMLAPAETAARLRFDELAQRFETAPRTHPLVTRALPLMYGTLASEPVLALLPASIVGPAVRAGHLALAPMPEMLPLDPLGLLLPERGSAEAAQALVEHLRGEALAVRAP